jgi:hypothetical protein
MVTPCPLLSRFDAVLGRARDGEEKYGVTGTPTFIVNGEKIVRSVPLEAIKKILDYRLVRWSRMVGQFSSVAKVYSAIRWNTP